MATATRIVQDAKVEGGYVKAETTDYRIYAVDGKEVERRRLSGTDVTRLDNRRFIPQPDRIVLDLSVEEAETLAVIGWATGGHPDGRRGAIDRIKAALQSAGVHYYGGTQYHPDLQTPLRFGPGYTPLSPTSGTGPSAGQNTAQSGAVSGRYTSSIDR